MKVSVLDALEHAACENSIDTLQRAVALARHAEAIGCNRYWIVEHHNVAFEACPAPEVMVAALAAATRSIRVGTGGVLLNNYSPYKVAEQARTLGALFPGRIDLGFGRSISGPGPDLALMRDRNVQREDDQSALVAELMDWLGAGERETGPFKGMAIMPDIAPGPDAWLLAASEATGALAGSLGLRLACSAFHRPALVPAIIAAYRAAFRPAGNGVGCETPEILIAVMGAVAETREEAELQAMPMRMANDLRRNHGIFLPHLPSREAAIAHFGGLVSTEVGHDPKYLIGGIDAVADHLDRLREDLMVDEILFRPMAAEPDQKRCAIEMLVATMR